MEWVKKNLLGKGTEDNATGSASSKPTLAACGVVLGSRTARDTELPPEGFPDHAAASMDGTAYLTQPGAVFDDGESSHDDGGGEVSDGNGDIRTEGRPKQPGFHTPKGQRLGAGGDVPSKFEASPVGRQHSSTTELLKLQATPVAEEKSPPLSLSQSVVELPLRSPSPLALFQMTQHSPPPKSSDKGDATEVDGAGPDSNKSEASPMPSDVDRKEVRFTPVKDPLESCKSASKENEMQQQHSQAVIAPAIDVDNSVEESQRKHLFQQMKMKKQAIHRALLHLSDSSYSFVYDEGTENGQLNGSSNGHEDDPGLPFIGPSLKEQYNTLRLLLHKGLLGHTKDDMKGEAKPKIAGRSRRRRDLGGDANLSAASHVRL